MSKEADVFRRPSLLIETPAYMYWCFFQFPERSDKALIIDGSMLSQSGFLIKRKWVCPGKFKIAILEKEKSIPTCSVTKTQVQHDLFPQLTSRGFPWNQKQKESFLITSTWSVQTFYFSEAGFIQTAGYKTTNWSLLWLIISATHEPRQGRYSQLALCYQHKKGWVAERREEFDSKRVLDQHNSSYHIQPYPIICIEKYEKH